MRRYTAPWVRYNETLLAKVLVYVKGLVTTQQKGADASVRNGWAAAAKQAHADGEDKLIDY